MVLDKTALNKGLLNKLLNKVVVRRGSTVCMCPKCAKKNFEIFRKFRGKYRMLD